MGWILLASGSGFLALAAGLEYGLTAALVWIGLGLLTSSFIFALGRV